MNLTIDIFNRVIHDLMSIVACQTIVGEQEVGIERGASLNMLADFTLKSCFLPVGDYGSANLSATLQNTHDRNLILGSSSGDSPLAFGDVHFTGLAADEGFVYFDSAAIRAPIFIM